MKDGKKSPEERYLLPAVEQATRVLFSMAATRSPSMSLIEICDTVGLHKSKAFSILETLQKSGLVRKNNDGKGYALGSGLISLARKVLDDLSPPRLAEPILEELANKTGCTAVLGLRDEKSVFVAARSEGEGNPGITMRIGHRLPLTFGAHGKAIAAFLSQEDQERLLKGGDLRFYGDPTRFHRERLLEELDRCRRHGFAEDLGQANPGLNVVAAPVLGPNCTPIGYIEIFVLSSSEAAHGFGALVAEAGKTLSRLLGCKGERPGISGPIGDKPDRSDPTNPTDHL